MKKGFLRRYGEFAAKEPEIVVSVVFIITILMGTSALAISIETDFTQGLPQDLKALEKQELLENVFSESDNLFVVIKLNENKAYEDGISDIRDPQLLKDVQDLENILRKAPEIESVQGVPDILVSVFGKIPDKKTIESFFDNGRSLFGRDYSITSVIITVSGGATQERAIQISERVQKAIDNIGFPGGVELTLTGSPIISKVIFDLLFADLTRTLALALVFIFIVISITYLSLVRGILAVLVLFFGFTWTLGSMNLIGIPLSVVTATMGALIVGIGVDYSIHIMNRYREETEKKVKNGKDCEKRYEKCVKNCIKCHGIAVEKTGKAIIATAATTIVSLLVLTLSGVPFLSDIGISLSLGILFALFNAVFVLPSLISLEDRLTYKHRAKYHREVSK